jgi:hypothetical protein
MCRYLVAAGAFMLASISGSPSIKNDMISSASVWVNQMMRVQIIGGFTYGV